MSRAGRAGLVLVAAAATGAGGYWVGRHGFTVRPDLLAHVPGLQRWFPSEPARAAPSGPVIYYRDPDGKPLYSAEPKTATDGRAWLPVHASEDVYFDENTPPGESAPSPMADGAKAEGRRVLYYRNPMGLPDASPTPKKDWMGMDYIPVYEGEEDNGTTVKVSVGKLQRAGVRTEPVERRTLSEPVRAPGVVEEDERRTSVVAVRSEAFIERVENVTTGDHVLKGQPLMRLYSPEINAAAAQYLSAVGYDGARRRLENLAVPNEVIAEIERTRKVPTAIVWSAPRDGVVIERNVKDGMRAAAGDVLFRIVDHSVVWVLADIPERDLGKVAEGQRATVRVRGFLDRAFAGPVTRIYPHLISSTRTARVRVEIANPDRILRPAMYADVEIAAGIGGPVLAVPDSAIIDTGARQVALVDKGEGRFEPRPVTVGRRGGGYVEVRDGVAEGEAVVVSANFLIDAESNLKAALKGFAAAEQAP
jgi:Cu(I)/Ag(I) efflux system membrane fusion protein